MDIDYEAVGGIIVAILVIGGLCLLPFVHFSSLSDGKHTGYVSAVDLRGIFFKNYTVFFKTNPQSSQEDEYCVSGYDKDLSEKLSSASANNQRVTISYVGVKAIGIGICEGAQIKEVRVDN